jgi:hypothetical protein
MSHHAIRPLVAGCFSAALLLASVNAEPPGVPAQGSLPISTSPTQATPPAGPVPGLPMMPLGPVVSGPQLGDRPGPLNPFIVTGPSAGRRSCLHCKYGLHPVVMVFAHDVTAPLVVLMKQLDAAIVAHANVELGSCVIVCSDQDDLAPRLEAFAMRESLSHLILATCPPEGPKGYQIAADAEVTVVLYTHGVVKANYAYRKGELTPLVIQGILAELPKILKEEPDSGEGTFWGRAAGPGRPGVPPQ